MDTFSALAEPRRREIIELIARKGSLSATDISDQFNISASAISQHLKVLREAKLVDVERRHQMRIYTINTSSLQEIERWIGKINKMWNEKFNRLDKVLEDIKNGK